MAKTGTEICTRLGEERRRLNLNQNKVAGFCTVSTKTVGRWEKNIPIPADKLALLADLGYDITYILTGVKLAKQVAGLDAAAQVWNNNEQSVDATGKDMSTEQKTWLGILEQLMDGDADRLKKIGLALIGYSNADTK